MEYNHFSIEEREKIKELLLQKIGLYDYGSTGTGSLFYIVRNKEK